jgi:hypothetical protein
MRIRIARLIAVTVATFGRCLALTGTAVADTSLSATAVEKAVIAGCGT